MLLLQIEKMKTWKTSLGNQIVQILWGRSHVFLIQGKGVNILIDTGLKISRQRLVRRLNKLNLSSIDYLVLTHTHFDHASNAAFIQKKYSARVVVHDSEKDFLKTGRSPLPCGTFFFTRFVIRLAKALNLQFLYEPCLADIAVHDEFRFSVSQGNIFVLHTPGHSAGSMSIIVDNEIALAGDTIFGVFRKGVFPPFADDTAQLFHSWKVLLETGCSQFIAGHGFPKTKFSVKNALEKRKPLNS